MESCQGTLTSGHHRVFELCNLACDLHVAQSLRRPAPCSVPLSSAAGMADTRHRGGIAADRAHSPIDVSPDRRQRRQATHSGAYASYRYERGEGKASSPHDRAGLDDVDDDGGYSSDFTGGDATPRDVLGLGGLGLDSPAKSLASTVSPAPPSPLHSPAERTRPPRRLAHSPRQLGARREAGADGDAGAGGGMSVALPTTASWRRSTGGRTPTAVTVVRSPRGARGDRGDRSGSRQRIGGHVERDAPAARASGDSGGRDGGSGGVGESKSGSSRAAVAKGLTNHFRVISAPAKPSKQVVAFTPISREDYIKIRKRRAAIARGEISVAAPSGGIPGSIAPDKRGHVTNCTCPACRAAAKKGSSGPLKLCVCCWRGVGGGGGRVTVVAVWLCVCVGHETGTTR